VEPAASAPLLRVLDFTRVEAPDDPYAFRFGAERYVLRGADGGARVAALEWDERLLADLQRLHGGSPEAALVQRLGELLRRFLEPAGWATQARAIMDARARGQPVLLGVRSAAAELYALPWELLVLDDSGRHVGELDDVLVRYEWPETATHPEVPSPRPEGGRIVVAWSAAGGVVPAGEHLRALADACAAGRHDFSPARDVVPHASPGALADALARDDGGPVAALHLLCHGGRRGATHGLWLDGERPEDGPVLVEAGRLRALLAPHAGRLRLVVLAACEGGASGELGNQLGSVAQALHRAGVASVIASRLPLSVRGSIVLTRTFYGALLGELRSIEASFLAARRALARDAGSLDWASLQLYARAADGVDSRPIVVRPYRGLLAFEPDHERLFFGREAEVAELLADLAALVAAGKPRLTIVTGASGTGKSSVVFAGALPRWLRGPEAPTLLHMRPGGQPLRALEALLAGRSDAAAPCLLIVDQFEEVFTHVEAPAQRERFVRRLWALACDRAQDLRIVVTLRVDFLGRCGELHLDDLGLRLDRIAYDEAHRVFVAQMPRAALAAAIERPAQAVGLSFEPGLVARLLAEVEGDPGSLPVLQDTLDLLWQRREGRTLTQAAIEALGGVTGALHGRADRLIDGLDPASRQVARRLLVRLVHVGSEAGQDARRRVKVAELRPHEAGAAGRFDAVLGALVAARLLVQGEEAGEPSIEVAHEALIRRWPRLAGWLAEDRVKLGELAKLAGWLAPWRDHQTPLVGAQLGYAIEVATRYSDEVPPAIAEMIRVSRAAEEARRRARRRTLVISRVSALVFAALSMIAARLWWIASAEETRANQLAQEAETSLEAALRNERRAEQEAALARVAAQVSRDSVRLAAAHHVGDPALRLAYLREVEVDDTRPIAAVTLAAWSSGVLASLTAPRKSIRLTHASRVEHVALRPDGGLVATAADDDFVRLWDPGRPTAPLRLLPHEGEVHALAFSPDGLRLATATDRGVWLWDARVEASPRLLEHATPVRAIAFSRDGGAIVSGDDDGVMHAWPLREPDARVLRVHAHGGGITAISVGAAGRLATGSLDRTARVWDADRLERRGAALRHDRAVSAVAFTPDGDGLFTLQLDGRDPGARAEDVREAEGRDADGTLRLWGLGGAGSSRIVRVGATWIAPVGQGLVVPDGGGAEVWSVAGGEVAVRRQLAAGHPLTGVSSSDDGRVAVTADGGLDAWIWEIEPPPPYATLTDLDARVVSIAVSPDGARVLTGRSDHTARLWQREPVRSLAELRHTGAGEVRAVAFGADGRSLITGGADDRARVWRADDPAAAPRELPHPGQVTSLGVRHDGVIVTCSSLRTARVWDPDRPEAPPREPLGVWAAATVICTEDGKIVAAGAAEPSRIRIWDADVELEALPGGSRPLTAAGSPDGSVLALGSLDAPATLWSLAGARTPLRLRRWDGEDEARVVAAAWSSDGPGSARVVTATGDRVVRVWDPARPEGPLIELLHPRGILAVATSADGATLAAVSVDGAVHVWSGWGSAAPRVHPALWLQLWGAGRLCPSVDERQAQMMIDRASAEQDHARCEAMRACMAEADMARANACRVEFQRSQASMASFDSVRVTTTSPAGTGQFAPLVSAHPSGPPGTQSDGPARVSPGRR
jgi:WD40 repeat protein